MTTVATIPNGPVWTNQNEVPNDLRSERQLRLLLIEDNKDAMYLVQHALAKHAPGTYKLEWARCLRDGLSQITNGGIDIVVLDLGLPDCSASSTCGCVRTAAPDLPVVILTGDPSEEMEASAIASGLEHYLVKGRASGPAIIEAIANAFERHQQSSRSMNSLSGSTPPVVRQARVLLIEDNTDATRWVQHAIKKYAHGNYRLECAVCLKEGLHRILKGGIDLVVLDLGLPDCSSLATFTWLLKVAIELPVVVLTGEGVEDARISMFARSVERYLVKHNTSPAQLADAIESALATGKRLD
jgi:DNA-binding response OmpR family regulator